MYEYRFESRASKGRERTFLPKIQMINKLPLQICLHLYITHQVVAADMASLLQHPPSCCCRFASTCTAPTKLPLQICLHLYITHHATAADLPQLVHHPPSCRCRFFSTCTSPTKLPLQICLHLYSTAPTVELLLSYRQSVSWTNIRGTYRMYLKTRLIIRVC